MIELNIGFGLLALQTLILASVGGEFLLRFRHGEL